EGRRLAAVFTSEVQGGDAEIIVTPPAKGERRSLAAYTGSPNFNEHFKTAVFLGAGDLYGEVMAQMRDNPSNRKVAELGPVLEEQWNPVWRNLADSYLSRLAYDLLSAAPPSHALFALLASGSKLGNFDVVIDPRAPDRVTVGQIAFRDNRSFFDTWTNYDPRNQPRVATTFGMDAELSDYRIEAGIAP